jgi:hypothetical protein
MSSALQQIFNSFAKARDIITDWMVWIYTVKNNQSNANCVLSITFLWSLEHPHPFTARVWYTAKLDDKCCGLFQIASGATTFQCQAKGPVKLILVRFILHSTCDWSISYLRGTFGVKEWPSFSWRALQMKKQYLSVSDLGRRGVDALIHMNLGTTCQCHALTYNRGVQQGCTVFSGFPSSHLTMNSEHP